MTCRNDLACDMLVVQRQFCPFKNRVGRQSCKCCSICCQFESEGGPKVPDHVVRKGIWQHLPFEDTVNALNYCATSFHFETFPSEHNVQDYMP